MNPHLYFLKQILPQFLYFIVFNSDFVAYIVSSIQCGLVCCIIIKRVALSSEGINLDEFYFLVIHPAFLLFQSEFGQSTF